MPKGTVFVVAVFRITLFSDGRVKSQVKGNTYCQTRLPLAPHTKCNFTSPSSRYGKISRVSGLRSPVFPIRCRWFPIETLIYWVSLLRFVWTALEVNANEIRKQQSFFWLCQWNLFISTKCNRIEKNMFFFFTLICIYFCPDINVAIGRGDLFKCPAQ